MEQTSTVAADAASQRSTARSKSDSAVITHERAQPCRTGACHSILDGLARVGDTIECDCKHPYPHTLSATLNTPQACALGNDLLMDPTSGWRLRRDLQH